MTVDETEEIIYILQSTYPNSYNRQTETQLDIMIKFWASCFIDYKLDVVVKALQIAIMKKKDFPPNIAEVNEQIVKIVKPEADNMDGEIAWGKVSSLIKKYGTYLSEEVRTEMNNEIDQDLIFRMALRAIGGLEAIRLCEMDNLNTLRAQFIRIYNSYKKRQQDDLLIPENLKQEVKKLQSKSISFLEKY